MPLITQSDHGTENYGIANAQTTLRHLQDPSLDATLQHKFRGNKGNIKPEIAWQRLRTVWTSGFEDTMMKGLIEELYNPDIPLQRCVPFIRSQQRTDGYLICKRALSRLVFHYLFIPWLQSKLDTYRTEANDTRPRYNRHKVLPLGRPVEIFENPEEYGTLDFGVRAFMP